MVQSHLPADSRSATLGFRAAQGAQIWVPRPVAAVDQAPACRHSPPSRYQQLDLARSSPAARARLLEADGMGHKDAVRRDISVKPKMHSKSNGAAQ
jgi:hypothetical protein